MIQQYQKSQQMTTGNRTKPVMHAAAGRRHAGTFSHAATPKPLKSAWRENLKIPAPPRVAEISRDIQSVHPINPDELCEPFKLDHYVLPPLRNR